MKIDLLQDRGRCVPSCVRASAYVKANLHAPLLMIADEPDEPSARSRGIGRATSVLLSTVNIITNLENFKFFRKNVTFLRVDGTKKYEKLRRRLNL